ncbi:MAG: hypothetical protein U0269_20305 [Polyangiales bacterium]
MARGAPSLWYVLRKYAHEIQSRALELMDGAHAGWRDEVRGGVPKQWKYAEQAWPEVLDAAQRVALFEWWHRVASSGDAAFMLLALAKLTDHRTFALVAAMSARRLLAPLGEPSDLHDALDRVDRWALGAHVARSRRALALDRPSRATAGDDDFVRSLVRRLEALVSEDSFEARQSLVWQLSAAVLRLRDNGVNKRELAAALQAIIDDPMRVSVGTICSRLHEEARDEAAT